MNIECPICKGRILYEAGLDGCISHEIEKDGSVKTDDCTKYLCVTIECINNPEHRISENLKEKVRNIVYNL